MNNEWRDYYKDLELEFGCSDEDIKNSYRTLIKKYHPDSEFADEDKAKEVNVAYGVLGDPLKRAEYDATYLQYKNGEFQEQENEEMPKYTHEEMHQAFTEEEIRFAERVALQKIINETLENSKIIIDAKNELLFAAFKDNYDEETYKDEYLQFTSISKDFISNLDDLVNQAKSYGLEDDVNTINQVIDFLLEVIEEIPLSLNEAKRKVKIELMREQLQSESEELIKNAQSIRSEFINLYGKVYKENIGKEDFLMYYNILKLGVVDVLSQLNNIYDLLKKASLDENFEKVGILIGQLEQDLKLYSGDYMVAKMLGNREVIKERIQESLLTFEEYKAKMIDIMQEIMQTPTSDNAMLLVTKARTLTNDFNSYFKEFDEVDYKNSEFLQSSDNFYNEAKNIYKRRNALHNKLTEIFDNTEKEKIGNKNLEFLKDYVEISEEELQAIELLHDVYILIGQYEEYRNITENDTQKLLEQIKIYLDKSQRLQKVLEEMVERISNVEYAYASLNSSDKFTFLLFPLASLIGCFLIFGNVLKEIDLRNIIDKILSSMPATLGSFITFGLLAAAFLPPSYSIKKDYNDLINGHDSHLQELYQKALKI